MRTLAVLSGEGFDVEIIEQNNGSVTMTSDMDIDADGGKNAYKVGDSGLEALANGGMGMRNGRVVFTKSWGPDIAVSGEDGHPMVIDGCVVTKTSYVIPGKDRKTFDAYLDSEKVPYIVVPPCIIRGVKGIVMGCRAIVEFNGKSVVAMVGDAGPKTKTGEGSIALAKLLGIPSSPRTGGIDKPLVKYTIFPGVEATINGVTYPLQASK